MAQSISHDLQDGKIRTKDVLLDEEVKFESLLLREEIQTGLRNNGFIYLSPIQRHALPLALTGRSLIVHAKCGTGKTLIFAINALYSVLLRQHHHLQCIVLAPTREIAVQNAEVITKLGCSIKDLNLICFIGGISVDVDVKKAEKCQIAVGTPGRINHLIDLGALKTNAVRLLVLDEVDQLFNDTFGPLVMKIISHLPATKQVITCCASLTTDTYKMLNRITNDFKFVSQNGVGQFAESPTSNVLMGLKHFIIPVESNSTSLNSITKRNKLLEVLSHCPYKQCFIFVNYITQARSICNFLNNNGIYAKCISSSQDQATRLDILNCMRQNRCHVLVTTDVASRGVDICDANLVINMSIPYPPICYLHRIGRAGRFGSEGIVATILHKGREVNFFLKLVSSVITESIKVYTLPMRIDKDITDFCNGFADCTMHTCNPMPDVDLEEDMPSGWKNFIKNSAVSNNSNENDIVVNNESGQKQQQRINGKKNKKRNNKKNKVKNSLISGSDGVGETTVDCNKQSTSCNNELKLADPNYNNSDLSNEESSHLINDFVIVPDPKEESTYLSMEEEYDNSVDFMSPADKARKFLDDYSAKMSIPTGDFIDKFKSFVYDEGKASQNEFLNQHSIFQPIINKISSYTCSLDDFRADDDVDVLLEVLNDDNLSLNKENGVSDENDSFNLRFVINGILDGIEKHMLSFLHSDDNPSPVGGGNPQIASETTDSLKNDCKTPAEMKNDSGVTGKLKNDFKSIDKSKNETCNFVGEVKNKFPNDKSVETYSTNNLTSERMKTNDEFASSAKPVSTNQIASSKNADKVNYKNVTASSSQKRPTSRSDLHGTDTMSRSCASTAKYKSGGDSAKIQPNKIRSSKRNRDISRMLKSNTIEVTTHGSNGTTRSSPTKSRSVRLNKRNVNNEPNRLNEIYLIHVENLDGGPYENPFVNWYSIWDSHLSYINFCKRSG